jgi:hypothetical protein
VTFEAFTVGTLLAIVAFCTVGYWWARRRDDAGSDFTASIEADLIAQQTAPQPLAS